MARNATAHDREVVFRKMLATRARPDDGRVRRAFEGPEMVEANLILKLTRPLAGCKLAGIGSSMAEPSVDHALQAADDGAVDVYIYLPKYNKLRGAQRRSCQPPARFADTIRTVKSARIHTD